MNNLDNLWYGRILFLLVLRTIFALVHHKMFRNVWLDAKKNKECLLTVLLKIPTHNFTTRM